MIDISRDKESLRDESTFPSSKIEYGRISRLQINSPVLDASNQCVVKYKSRSSPVTIKSIPASHRQYFLPLCFCWVRMPWCLLTFILSSPLIVLPLLPRSHRFVASGGVGITCRNLSKPLFPDKVDWDQNWLLFKRLLVVCLVGSIFCTTQCSSTNINLLDHPVRITKHNLDH